MSLFVMVSVPPPVESPLIVVLLVDVNTTLWVDSANVMEASSRIPVPESTCWLSRLPASLVMIASPFAGAPLSQLSAADQTLLEDPSHVVVLALVGALLRHNPAIKAKPRAISDRRRSRANGLEPTGVNDDVISKTGSIDHSSRKSTEFATPLWCRFSVLRFPKLLSPMRTVRAAPPGPPRLEGRWIIAAGAIPDNPWISSIITLFDGFFSTASTIEPQ